MVGLHFWGVYFFKNRGHLGSRYISQPWEPTFPSLLGVISPIYWGCKIVKPSLFHGFEVQGNYMLIYPCFDWSLGLVLEGETTTKKEDIHRFQVYIYIIYIYNIYIYIKSLTENTLLFSSTFFSHPTTNSKTLSEILRCDCRHYWPWFYDHKDFGGLMNWFAKKTLVFVGVKQLTPSPPKKKEVCHLLLFFLRKMGGNCLVKWVWWLIFLGDIQ